MTDHDDVDARFSRARERHAARENLRNKPRRGDAEPAPHAEGFAASVAVTKAERAWIREHLGPLHDRELIADVLQRIKAGKEATVYACSGGPASTSCPKFVPGSPHPRCAGEGRVDCSHDAPPARTGPMGHSALGSSSTLGETRRGLRVSPTTGVGVVAAKLYRARSLRGERNVGHYQQGRAVLDVEGRAVGERAWRLQKAIAQKSRAGRKAAQSSWLMHEYSVLAALSAQGGDVPQPIEHTEFALLMEFIGDGVEAAPTLSQLALTSTEATPLLERVLFNLELLLGLGWVHGDLSAHNILYHRGRVVLIDFPQVVATRGNPNAHAFFERDVERVAQYFGRAGVSVDSRRWASQLWAKHVGAEAPP